MKRGSLSVVGTGHRIAGQITVESQFIIRRADWLFFLVDEDLTALWLRELNPAAESLRPFYVRGRSGVAASYAMVECILSAVRRGAHVCAAFSGHPGVYVRPASDAVLRARSEGFPARMYPGISAVDCMFADLGVDPATHGCSIFEATDFLVCRRRFDPRRSLVLLQAGAIGVTQYVTRSVSRAHRLSVLARVLQRSFSPRHEVIIYDSVALPPFAPVLQRVTLRRLAEARVNFLSTIYVPPLGVTL
jgi:precorrin-3B methylase